MIEFTRKGQGSPAIVFVHGFGCARSDWDLQVGHLAARHETIAVDLGGHGTSPGTEAHARIETHGADVAGLLASERIERAVLVGHSMGCRIAMAAALSEPKRVAGLILVDGSRMGAAGASDHVELAAHIKTIGYQAFVRPVFAAMFSPAYPKAAAEAIIERAAARPAAIAGALFPDIRRWDSETMDRVVGSIRVPTLVIQSTRLDEQGKRVSMRSDKSSPYLDLLKSAIKDLTIEIVPEIGHFPQLERPEAVNRAMDTYLARI